MDKKPKCVIVTGRAGAGKSTLAHLLGRRLWMPVISRDEIKEGYVNTFGMKHDQLSPDTDGNVTDLFFRTAFHLLEEKVSIVIEAAFQHPVWEYRMPQILTSSSPLMVICSIEDVAAARRHLQRGLENPEREFYHGDNRVVHFRKTGEFLHPAPYAEPNLDIPTIRVSTASEYVPSLADIAARIKGLDTSH